MRITRRTTICALAAISVSVLTSCSKPARPDIRFSLVTSDGGYSGVPSQFLDAFSPGVLSATPQPGSPPQHLLDNTKSLVLRVQVAGDSETKALLSDGTILVRVYWKPLPGLPSLKATNNLRCRSGAIVKPSLGRRLYSLKGETILEQYFSVPKMEQPESFIVEGKAIAFAPRTKAQSDEEKAWGNEFLHDPTETQKY